MTHEPIDPGHFDGRFELKFLAETGVFEGYASVFNVVDQVRDKIAPGAFRESLAACRKSGRLPPLLWQHEALEPIGAWREMYEDNHGLFVKGDLFINDIALAKEAYKLLKENVVTGLSIGYRTQESHYEKKSGVRVLTKLDLMEVSLVTFPANDQARVIAVKRLFSGGNMPSEREFEAYLRESGLSRRLAKGVIAQGYKALIAPSLHPIENDLIGTFIGRMQQATAETKTATAVHRLNLSLRKATADALKRKWARKETLPDEEEELEGGDVAVPGIGSGGLDLMGGGDGSAAAAPEEDADTLSAANNAIGALSSDEGNYLGYTLSSGTANGYPLSDTLDNGFGDDIPEDVADRLTNAGQSIIDHLGDDAWAKQNENNGNYYMMNGDGDKVRFDISDPGDGPDGLPDDPHYHFETQDENGDDVDAGNQHRYYFNDDNDDDEE